MPTFHRSGGAETVANMLKGVSKDATRAVMAQMEGKNPRLATAVRRKLFSFEDLSRLRPSDMQRLMREVDSSQLALALKGTSEGLQEKIFPHSRNAPVKVCETISRCSATSAPRKSRRRRPP